MNVEDKGGHLEWSACGRNNRSREVQRLRLFPVVRKGYLIMGEGGCVRVCVRGIKGLLEGRISYIVAREEI